MIKFSIDSSKLISIVELDDGIFSTLYEIDHLSYRVSVDTLQWVMKVPMAALKAIGREANIIVEDKPGACIDENALGCFADAYIRKMKHYFHQSRRYKNRLSPEEKATFKQFCKQFKKLKAKVNNKLTWADIDEKALRKYFYQQVLVSHAPYKTPCVILCKVTESRCYLRAFPLPETTIDFRCEIQAKGIPIHYLHLSHKDDTYHILRRTVLRNLSNNSTMQMMSA